MKMLQISFGVTRMDRIRKRNIRGTAQVVDKVIEASLRCFGHVHRRDAGYFGRRLLRMEPPGRRRRGRPKKRLMDVVIEDMQVVGVKEEDAEDRARRTQMIRCSDPQLRKAKRRRRSQ